MASPTLEERVAALEAEVARLKSQQGGAAAPGGLAERDKWWERIHGTFPDDEMFREAMRLGREWRTGKKQRPAGPKGKAKRRKA
jgi:hypothetical protein